MRKRVVLAGLVILTLLSAGTAHRDVFTIPLPKHQPLRFIVAGDAGTGDGHLRKGIASLTQKMSIDGILLVGDNVYPCGVTSVDDPEWRKVNINFDAAGIPVYAILGNHDYGDPTPINGKTVICGQPSPGAEVRASGKVPNWVFPNRNYTLHAPWVDIVMMDTQPIASEFTEPFLGSETLTSELDWITSALDGSGRGWRIAVGHHTIFSSGIHGISNHRDQRHLRADLLPLLLREKVDMYICGHDHDAELIGDLKRRDKLPLFLISGDGAHSELMEKRNRAGEPPTIFPKSFPPEPLVGFTLLEITPKQISMTFYDGTGLKRSDTYTTRKR